MQNDGEFLQYCLTNFPDAKIDNANTETYDEVIKAFSDYGYQWATFKLKDGRKELVAWEHKWFGWHCYAMVEDSSIAWLSDDTWLGSGWLYHNGVRVQAYDLATFSMDPQEIVKLYQYGYWLGMGYLRSDDYGTVAMNDNGKIKYSYSAKFYPKDTHTVTAYTDYDEPWWNNCNSIGLNRIIASSYETNDSEASGYCETNYYLDLPIAYDPGKIYAADWYYRDFIMNSDSPGAFFLTDDGMLQYARGELLEKWDFTAASPEAEDCFVVPVRSEHGYLAYVYDGRRLLGLKTGGKYDVLMNRVIKPAMPGPYDSLFGLVEGKLVYWYYDTYLTLAEDVIYADFSEVKLFEKADGSYAITGEDIYSEIRNENTWSIVYLGPESLEHYLQAYKVLDAGRYVD